MALTLAMALTACSGGDGGGEGPATEQPGVFRSITTWAGSPDPGGPGDSNGAGSAARFRHPDTVAAASDGSLWIAESTPSRLRRIAVDGTVTTVFEGGALLELDGPQFLFISPGAMVAAPSGGVFVAMRQTTLRPGDGPWAVLRFAPGLPQPQLLVLPAWQHGINLAAAALALDRQGRLHIAADCSIWRTDGEVLATARPRGAVRTHVSGPVTEGPGCGTESLQHGITRLALDAEDRPLFTLRRGDVMRLEPDLRTTTLGHTSAGSAALCGGMVADGRGGLLLSGGSPTLMRLDATGQEQVVAGSPQQRGWFDGPAASARFATLCGVAVDREGRIVLVDSDNHAVRRMASDGSVSTVAGLAPQAGYRDGEGKDALFGSHFEIGPGLGSDVIVGDAHNATVRRVDSMQRVSTLVGAPRTELDPIGADGPVATARLASPGPALMTADGSLWFGDLLRLKRLGTDGMVRTLASRSPDGGMTAMALDRAGDVLVAWGGSIAFHGRFERFQHFERYSSNAPEGAPQRLEAGLPPELLQRLDGATAAGLCVLPTGNLVFTQRHAVLLRAADGSVTVLAGSPDEAGAGDGTAAVARFQWPSGLACDAVGGIYVADSGNHTVRYIDAQRNVRTVLGQAGRPGHRVDAAPGELHTPRSLALVPGGLVVATGQGLVRAGF